MAKPSSSRAWLLALLLLLAPAAGAFRLGDWPAVGVALGLYAVLSLVSFLQMRADKRRAGRAERRIPERQLHTLELLGGWAGSWLAQQLLRHKTRKGSYQLVFWAIVLVHQAIGVWCLLGPELR